VVLAARGESQAASDALEILCRSYWRPIYSFLRREGRSVEDAQDLTQAFFARFVERHDFDAVRQQKGRLRCYLLVARKPAVAISVASLTALAVALSVIIWKSAMTLPRHAKGIAVLPFENMSADKANSYLADGIQDEI